jgi:hypothetical protein
LIVVFSVVVPRFDNVAVVYDIVVPDFVIMVAIIGSTVADVSGTVADKILRVM